jgi:hypothetical protein
MAAEAPSDHTMARRRWGMQAAVSRVICSAHEAMRAFRATGMMDRVVLVLEHDAEALKIPLLPQCHRDRCTRV